MAITEKIQAVKVYLDLTKGSQTISNCKIDATSEALHSLGTAVGSLHVEEVQQIVKITETVLA